MLPRIVDLAENSLNRQIKVASCELVHSLMILMIGSSAFRARDAKDPKKVSVVTASLFANGDIG
jgi:DNA-dependent protein kinase catalytic subunit